MFIIALLGKILYKVLDRLIVIIILSYKIMLLLVCEKDNKENNFTK